MIVCSGVCCNTLHAPPPYVVGASSSYEDNNPSKFNGSTINEKKITAIPMMSMLEISMYRPKHFPSTDTRVCAFGLVTAPALASDAIQQFMGMSTVRLSCRRLGA